MVLICLKIFMARVVDVTLGTIRTILLSKEKVIEPFIIAFFEVIIWFIVAKEALSIADKINNTLLIAVFYAAGYATGTLIGSKLSRKFSKSMVKIEVISSKNIDDLLNSENILVNKIKLNDKKILYFFDISGKSSKNIVEKINKIDKNCHVVVNDTRYVSSSIFK